jgi:hypothetical protein
MRRRLPIVAGLALAVGLLTPAAASANHAWGGYHWERSSSQVSVALGDNVGSSWQTMLNTASSDWSASSVLNTSVVSSNRNPSTCEPTLGRVEVCNASYGNTNWLGIAQIWIYRGSKHIAQGTVKVNDTYFNQSPYNTTAWRNYVMCQEVGHTFGLDHQDETQNNVNLGSCMDYTNDPDGGAGGASGSDPNNEHPNAHDYEELETIYSHLDGSKGPKPHGPQGNHSAAGAADWGFEVAQSNSGHTSVFLRDLGDEGALVTFVIWT